MARPFAWTARSGWRLSRLPDFLQLGLVQLRALDVSAGPLEKVIPVPLLELADHLSRLAEHEDAIGDVLALGDERVRADQRALADLRAVHHHAVDADERAFADRAAMQHHLVSDRDMPGQ